MVEHTILRPGDFSFDILLLPDKQLSQGGPVELRCGTRAPTLVDLEPRFFRLILTIALAELFDECEDISSHFRGFRSTGALAQAYVELVGDVVPISDQAVIKYVSEIRNAFRIAFKSLAQDHGISPPSGLDPIEHRNRFGYRLGNVRVRILDYRRCAR